MVLQHLVTAIVKDSSKRFWGFQSERKGQEEVTFLLDELKTMGENFLFLFDNIEDLTKSKQ